MPAPLEIRACGAHASIQDAGRGGYRRMGIPGSGTLAPSLMQLGNALVGNPLAHPVIECFDGGQQLEAQDVALRLAVTGHVRLQLDAGAYPERITPTAWRSFLLEPGQRLRVLTIEKGRLAVIAVAGLQAPRELGSASCYARAGLAGRPLQAGDVLKATPARRMREQVLATAPTDESEAPVRVILGPQSDHFSEAAWQALLHGVFHVGEATDRMGMRLDGPRLEHRTGCEEIVSDATVPGAIQVPANGQPIVLLADGQTAGGYPKIATVLSCDLERLANRRAGQPVRFQAISAQAGEQAVREAAQRLQAQCRALRSFEEGGVDLTALRWLNHGNRNTIGS